MVDENQRINDHIVKVILSIHLLKFTHGFTFTHLHRLIIHIHRDPYLLVVCPCPGKYGMELHN